MRTNICFCGARFSYPHKNFCPYEEYNLTSDRAYEAWANARARKYAREHPMGDSEPRGYDPAWDQSEDIPTREE